MAEAIQKQQTIDINDTSIECVQYCLLGRDWVKQFLNRYPHLNSTTIRAIDAAQTKSTSKNVLTAWFNAFHEVVHERNVFTRKYI